MMQMSAFTSIAIKAMASVGSSIPTGIVVHDASSAVVVASIASVDAVVPVGVAIPIAIPATATSDSSTPRAKPIAVPPPRVRPRPSFL